MCGYTDVPDGLSPYGRQLQLQIIGCGADQFVARTLFKALREYLQPYLDTCENEHDAQQSESVYGKTVDALAINALLRENRMKVGSEIVSFDTQAISSMLDDTPDDMFRNRGVPTRPTVSELGVTGFPRKELDDADFQKQMSAHCPQYYQVSSVCHTCSEEIALPTLEMLRTEQRGFCPTDDGKAISYHAERTRRQAHRVMSIAVQRGVAEVNNMPEPLHTAQDKFGTNVRHTGGPGDKPEEPCVPAEVRYTEKERRMFRVPKNVKEALHHPDLQPMWTYAYWQEINNLIRHECFTLERIDHPEVRQNGIFPCLVLFTLKMSVDVPPKFKKAKCRIVADGARRPPKRDETGRVITDGIVSPWEHYSPTAGASINRFFDAYCVYRGFKLFGTDCTAAFLNAPVTKPVFVRLPYGTGHHGYCMRLHNHLYGLQEPHLSHTAYTTVTQHSGGPKYSTRSFLTA